MAFAQAMTSTLALVVAAADALDPSTSTVRPAWPPSFTSLCIHAFKRTLGHDEQHDLGNFEADLQTEGGRCQRIERRIAPVVAMPGHQDAVAAFAAEPKSAFDELRNHHDAASGLNQMPRVAEFRIVHGLIQYNDWTYAPGQFDRTLALP